MKKILVINNYDSFVHNIMQLLKEKSKETLFEICLNDQIPMSRLNEYNGLVLSPGPGIPKEANQLLHLIAMVRSTHPILGICLGHQALAESFGGKLRLLKQPLHGHKSDLSIIDNKDPLLKGLQQPVSVGRYHSWVIEAESLPKEMTVSSLDEDGEVMSMFHRELPIHGLQFHPESHLSNYGAEIVGKWLDSVR